MISEGWRRIGTCTCRRGDQSGLMEEFDTLGMGSIFSLLLHSFGGLRHVVMRWYITESYIHELKMRNPHLPPKACFLTCDLARWLCYTATVPTLRRLDEWHHRSLAQIT